MSFSPFTSSIIFYHKKYLNCNNFLLIEILASFFLKFSKTLLLLESASVLIIGHLVSNILGHTMWGNEELLFQLLKIIL